MDNHNALREVAINVSNKKLDEWGRIFNRNASFEFTRVVTDNGGNGIDAVIVEARRAGLKAVFLAMVEEGISIKWPEKL